MYVRFYMCVSIHMYIYVPPNSFVLLNIWRSFIYLGRREFFNAYIYIHTYDSIYLCNKMSVRN
jgi:hypothetical protein